MAKYEDDKQTAELDTNKIKPVTKLGEEVSRQYRAAITSRTNIQVGDYSLDEVLRECFNARDNRTGCEEKELRESYPEWAAMPISLVSYKVGILIALVRESLVGVAGAPFVIEDTPEPDIPKEVRDREVAKLADDVTQATMDMQALDPTVPIDEDKILELIRDRKSQVVQAVRKHAEEQAILLQRKLYDKTIQGGYAEAVMAFTDDFGTYPYAVLHGPYPVYRDDVEWQGNEFVETKKLVYEYERVSPFDFIWTEDCTNSQDGTAVFIRKKVPYNFLADAMSLLEEEREKEEPLDEMAITAEGVSGFVYKNLKDVLEMARDGELPRRWLDMFHKNPEERSTAIQWRQGDTIDLLIRYGRFLGSDLREMGFTDVTATRAYETKVVMVGGRVVQCHINKNPSKYKRPVFTASFESRNGTIVGEGLGQRLLPVHKAYRSCILLAMHNLGLSAEPITELDVNRVIEYMPDEWLDDPYITPGQVIPADGDRGGNNGAAVKFTQIPNITAASISMAEYIMNLTHSISNIPAALHGQPVGSGANRTVRGLLALQGNTLKPIHSSLTNMDFGVIQPMVQLTYRLLVIYDDDFEYTGDAKVVAKGAASMVQQEIERQEAMENIQMLGQLGDNINPDITNRAVETLLVKAKLIEPGERVFMTPPASPPQAPQAPQMQGIPGQAPVDPQGLPPLPPLSQ